MRYLIAIVAVVLSVGSVSARTCKSMCKSLDECKGDKHSSYCKSWLTKPHCFGLYYTDEAETEMCFRPNNRDCKSKRPVKCPETVPTMSPANNCKEFCNNTLSCKNDPQHHSSYCKSKQQNCSGLYYTDASRTATCFKPVDGKACPANFPVKCNDEVVGAVSTLPEGLKKAKKVKSTNAAPETSEAATTVLKTKKEKKIKATTETPTTTTTEAPTTKAKKAKKVTTTTETSTTTTTEAPTTKAKKAKKEKAPITGVPSGKYEGTSDETGTISMSAVFNAKKLTVDVTFKMGSKVVEGKKIPYTLEGENLILTNGPVLQDFLARCPQEGLTQEDIEITYNAATDEATATFVIYTVVGRKAA
jgi:hypothetical protein